MYRMAWAIYNSMMTGVICTLGRDFLPTTKVLVAPSSKWTSGYPEDIRHKIAKVTASNHDLRECECMIALYKMNPEKWVSFPQYYSTLTANWRKGGKRR
jgi:hypothetical protein